jgi:hypothetical protein
VRRWRIAIAIAGAMAAMSCAGSDPPHDGTTTDAMPPASTQGEPDADSTGAGSTTLPPLPDPSAGDGPSAPSQSAACQAWVGCAMALLDPQLEAIVDEYGSQGSCWVDSATAAACDVECMESLDTTRTQLEGAGDPVPPACDPPRDVPLSEIEDIFEAHCVDACHEPGGEEPSLDLSTQPRDELLEVVGQQSTIPHVTAGDHAASYLWHKISGSQGSVGGMGARMPIGAPSLTAEQIEAISDWIDAGAQP